MASPVLEVPEHFPIDVNEQGEGPVFGDEIARTECWCGPGRPWPCPSGADQ